MVPCNHTVVVCVVTGWRPWRGGTLVAYVQITNGERLYKHGSMS